MGACFSWNAANHAAITMRLRGWKSAKSDSTLLTHTRANVQAGPWPVPLYKYSELFAPPQSAGPTVPAVVMIHGFVFEVHFAESCMGSIVSLILGSNLKEHNTWAYMKGLATKVAAEGFAVLMIGLRDDDEEVLRADFPDMTPEEKAMLHKVGSMGNAWPTKYYAKALNAAIDHLIYAAKTFHGVEVDDSRIGFVGHSMGGGGVLYAAGVDSVDRIAAVAALNPAFGSVEAPFDNLKGCSKYLSGADHSGEFGEGEVPVLAKIKVPTLIYGSQAEYNTKMIPGDTCNFMWPYYPSVYAQVGAKVKELYVDNVTSATCGQAHGWCCTTNPDDVGKFADGVPLKVLLSFLRRYLANNGELPMARPLNAKEWA